MHVVLQLTECYHLHLNPTSTGPNVIHTNAKMSRDLRDTKALVTGVNCQQSVGTPIQGLLKSHLKRSHSTLS